MSEYNDAAGNRSKKRVVQNRRQSMAREEEALINIAKKIGHHGKENFIEYVRQTRNTNLRGDYVDHIFQMAGFKGKDNAG